VSVATELEIYNLALNAIGARNNVLLTTEATREAQVCKLWYSPVRDQVLSAAVWPEATKLASLTLLDERDFDDDWVSTNARPGYTYAYDMPSDLLHPQYLSDFSRFLITEYPGSKVALVTNTESAILAYTSRLVTMSLWSASLQMAVVYALASHISQPLTGKGSQAKMLAEKANGLIWAARERAANSSNERFEVLPDWIQGRGYGGSIQNTQYFHPLGDLFVSS